MIGLRARIAGDAITADVTFGAPHRDDWKDATGYTVTLERGDKTITVPFYMGSAHTDEPDAATVLDCLISDALTGDEDFEDFCGSFGYDTDSRSAYKTWEACRDMGLKLREFLGDDFDAYAYDTERL